MKEYIFVLGRDPKLSLIELISYFKAHKIDFELKEHSDQAIVFLLPDIDFNLLIGRLGGTVKICRVISKGFDNNTINNLQNFFTENKIVISISDIFANRKLKESFLYKLKQELRQQSIKFLIKTNLSPSKLAGSDILKKGMDIILFKNYIGITLAVSNPRLFEQRDKERPNNDFLRGTSLRLSKILINLSGAKSGQTILDPFCGFGIIIEEGLFLGFNVIGVDLDSAVCKKTEKNLNYFSSKYHIKNKFRIINNDSKKINKIITISDFDSIVSEPYLGPYIKKTYTIDQAKQISLKLEDLYNIFFRGLKEIVKNQTIVMIFPKFKTKQNKIIGPDINKILSINGFAIPKITNLVSVPLLYYNPNSKIMREIYIIKSSEIFK